MDKTFKTVKGCVSYILKNANTGSEKTLNDVVMFGMGIYAFKQDIPSEIGTQKKNDLFVSLNESELTKAVEYLLKNDGYLAC